MGWPCSNTPLLLCKVLASEDDKNDWLKTRDVFSRCLPFFNKKQVAVAMCCYDADLSGMALPVLKFAKIAKLSSSSLFMFIRVMKRAALRLVEQGKI